VAKCLTIFAIAILFSGCASEPPHLPIDAPPRPIFEEYSEALWQSIPREAREKIVADDINMKRYIKTVEARIEIHNGQR